MLMNDKKCEQVRNQLEEMQYYGGAAIKPLGLYEIIYNLLNEHSPSSMNRSKTRDIVDTFCALCNEYYLISSRNKDTINEFFMTNERWDKYYLGQKARENSIKILNELGLISYRLARNPYKPINTVRMYSIDLSTLKLYTELARENYLKKKKVDDIEDLFN